MRQWAQTEVQEIPFKNKYFIYLFIFNCECDQTLKQVAQKVFILGGIQTWLTVSTIWPWYEGLFDIEFTFALWIGTTSLSGWMACWLAFFFIFNPRNVHTYSKKKKKQKQLLA